MNHTDLHTLQGQNSEILSIKPGGTYSNHCAVNS